MAYKGVKRNIYNMVMLYDEYLSVDFLNFVQSKLNPEFVQLETAQLENIQKRDAINSSSLIVQSGTAQLSAFPKFVGMILRPSADQVVVEYAMNRSMSPTLIAEYKKKLIPQETVQKLLGEYCASFEMGATQRKKVSTKRKNK